MTTNKDEAQPVTHATYKQRQAEILRHLASEQVDYLNVHDPLIAEAAQQLDALMLEAIEKIGIGSSSLGRNNACAELRHIITGDSDER